MILVFGGTTEGKKVAACLSNMDLRFVYSTKTETEFIAPINCTYRFGAFSEQTFKEFCVANKISLIIHAGHPFAIELARTIEVVAGLLQLEVIRFERKYPERINHRLVHYLKDYKEALTYLNVQSIEPLLLLTGVQSIGKLKEYWDSHVCYARILPRESSLQLAIKEEFPEENLILEMPNDSVAAEKQLIDKYKIKGILTKESGDSGFLDVKIQAAIERGVPIMIIERTKSVFRCITEEAELKNHLSSLYNG